MNALITKVAALGLLFVLVFVSGFQLTRGGRPYGMLLFNLHKFLALGVLAFAAVTAWRMGQTAAVGALQIAILAVAGACFLAAIVTGGLLSALQSPPALAGKLHHALPYAVVLGSSAALALLAH